MDAEEEELLEAGKLIRSSECTHQSNDCRKRLPQWVQWVQRGAVGVRVSGGVQGCSGGSAAVFKSQTREVSGLKAGVRPGRGGGVPPAGFPREPSRQDMYGGDRGASDPERQGRGRLRAVSLEPPPAQQRAMEPDGPAELTGWAERAGPHTHTHVCTDTRAQLRP